MSKSRIVFQPSGRQGEIPDGTTLLDAARMLGVGIESICGGRQTCAKCRIAVAVGQYAKYGITSAPDSVTPIEAVESEYRARGLIRPDERLACAACVSGDVVINVPPEAQAQKQVVRKAATQRMITVAPVVRQVYVEVEPAEAAGIGNRRSDWERLQEAISVQHGLNELSIDGKCLPTLGKTLRAGRWATILTIWDEREVIRLRPGYSEGLYGLAVDLGTTTIAAYLCDLRTGEVLATETAMNPQIVYGEDLMSRVSYGMMNPDGANRMHRAVIKALNDIAATAAESVGLGAEDIVDMVAVGNPIMHHLLLNIDPVELGGAPFAMTIRDALDLKARDVGLRINPGAYLHTLPLQAGHVGADCTGVALTEALHMQDRLTLIVDVGTNAELLLGDRRGVLSASSPTGPAFEGAQITHGQRAAPGAIERVRIDPITLEARFKVIGQADWSDTVEPDQLKATGICGSGIVEAIGEMFLAGIIRTDGRFTDREHPRLIITGRKSTYILATANQTATGAPIVVTQDDVRAIQLAKGALYAGARLLMTHYRSLYGERPIERVMLAGAFGSYIDPKYAMLLGMIPDCDLANVSAIGNAAGDGARIALVNRAARLEAQTIARSIHYVETATDTNFQDAFVGAMHIPHMNDAFPHLAGILPEAALVAAPRRRRTVR